MVCGEMGEYYRATTDECVTSCSGTTPLINADNNTCVVRCLAGQGTTSTGTPMCTATANNDSCMNANRRYDIANDECRADNTCASNTFLGGGGLMTNSCYTLMECVDANGGLSSVGSGTCVAATEMTCYNAGSTTHFLQGSACVTSCTSGTTPIKRSSNMMNDVCE